MAVVLLVRLVDLCQHGDDDPGPGAAVPPRLPRAHRNPAAAWPLVRRL
ncbi:hypothetical protein ACFPM0_05440 [Pseudonocardia sulfidoxydans]